MAAGACIAVRRFPDMEGLGLEVGTNCLAWDKLEDLVLLLRTWTAEGRENERYRIREAAAALAHARFSWERSTEELLAIVRDYRARRGLQ